MLQHLREHRQEEGFTLIELMVVVLIMGILMAIAIPTFLSTRSSANDASGKSNATNAFINEKSSYASNQVFLLANTTATGAVMDNSLPWGVGQTNVAAYVSVAGTTLEVVAGSSSGNCFYIDDTETTGAAYIGYAETKGSTTGCYAPAVATVPTAISAVSAGSAAATVTSALPTVFWSSF